MTMTTLAPAMKPGEMLALDGGEKAIPEPLPSVGGGLGADSIDRPAQRFGQVVRRVVRVVGGGQGRVHGLSPLIVSVSMAPSLTSCSVTGRSSLWSR